MDKFSFVFIVVFIGNLLALINDTVMTWSSPVLLKLNSSDPTVNPLKTPITENEESWIASLNSLGALLGSLPFGFLSDRYGRKAILLLLAVPHIVSYALFAFATNVYMFYFGRFFGGISLAGVYIVLPMYIAEVAEPSYRGMLLVSYAVFAGLGDFVCYALGPYVSILTFNVVLFIIPVVFLISFALVAPESPHYLVGRDDEKAEAVLIVLRPNSSNIQKELEEIRSEKKNNVKGDMWNTIKKKYVIKGFIIAIAVTVFQVMSGITAVLAYTQIIFEDANINIGSDVSSIIIGATLILTSIAGVFIVDRKGRRFLLLLSALGTLISHTGLGLYFYLQETTNVDLKHFSWMPVICVVSYIVTFGMGFGPLSFAITCEILPSNVKFFLASVISLCAWLLGFLTAKFFTAMNNSLGRGGTFWFYGAWCFCALLFIYFIIPETKGRSFQEIHDILDGPFFLKANLKDKKIKAQQEMYL